MDTLSLHASAPGQRSPTKQQYPFERAATIHPFERRKSFDAPIVVELPELPEAPGESQIYERSEPVDAYAAPEIHEPANAFEQSAAVEAQDEEPFAGEDEHEHEPAPVDAYEPPVPSEEQEEQELAAESVPVDAWEPAAPVEAHDEPAVADEHESMPVWEEPEPFRPELDEYVLVEEDVPAAAAAEDEEILAAIEPQVVELPAPAVEAYDRPAGPDWYEGPVEADTFEPVAEPAAPAVELQPVAHPFAPAEPAVADGWVQETIPLEQLEFAERRVIVRLSTGETLEVASANTATLAVEAAREVVRHIGEAEDAGNWPELAGRFVRPDTIVSVDVQIAG